MTTIANDHNSADLLPLVSIVIPTFNQGQYLPACVDHCLFQTYRNIEIIIVDGGSSDDSKEYLASLPATIASRSINPVVAMSETGEIIRKTITTCPQDRDLQIISFPTDIGATRTINEGLAKATGKYCTYVVGDDLPHPHMIEEMVSALENSDADFVYADMNLIDDQGNIVRQMRLPDYDPQTCLAQWYHIGVCRLYRREWHDKIGLMDEDYKSANDYDHYLRFAMAGCRFYHLPRVLYSIRWHGENRKTGQHTNERYTNLMDESQRCALRASQWLTANQTSDCTP